MKSPVKTRMSAASRRAIYVAVAVIALVLVLLFGRGGIPRNPLGSTEAPVYGYAVVNEYPHDPAAFTQGLVYDDGFLYEGTGRRGQSSLRKVEIETGEVLDIRPLPADLFGEGVTIRGDSIFQLTLDAQTLFVYDKHTFDIVARLTYATHGWGLTSDDRNLIMSDGTSALHFMDPASFTRVGQVIVKDGNRPLIGLNELEYVKGEVFANVWRTDLIARISPKTGKVLGWVDLAGLLGPEYRTESTGVLNGIAYDAAGDRLFVTGKNWARLYEIEITKP
jgi:glutamine cyclotransferase